MDVGYWEGVVLALQKTGVFFTEDGRFIADCNRHAMSDCKTVQAVTPVIILACEDSGEVSISRDRLGRRSENGSPPAGPGENPGRRSRGGTKSPRSWIISFSAYITRHH